MPGQNSAMIDRQILVFYRAQAGALGAGLPLPLRLRMFRGHAIAALSLVRLKPPRPRLMPSLITTQPEHLAHQIAVEWMTGDEKRDGWFILRRDTTARSALLGGNIFPGKLHHARFHVHEQDGRFRINCDSDDDQSHVKIDALAADFLPKGALFDSVDEAREFLLPATAYITAGTFSGEAEGMEVVPTQLAVRAMAVWEAKSSLFQENPSVNGPVELDCGVLLRNVEYEWSEAPAEQITSRSN